MNNKDEANEFIDMIARMTKSSESLSWKMTTDVAIDTIDKLIGFARKIKRNRLDIPAIQAASNEKPLIDDLKAAYMAVAPSRRYLEKPKWDEGKLLLICDEIGEVSAIHPGDDGFSHANQENDDPLQEAAWNALKQTAFPNVGYIQGALLIGYNRARRLMDVMIARGQIIEVTDDNGMHCEFAESQETTKHADRSMAP